MGKFCPEPLKPKHLLLPAKLSFYVDRNDPECDYKSGDSDYFPMSSDDEEDNKIRGPIGPTVSSEEKEKDKSINTWASKLFPKKI
jgi:hypothetical protein